MVSSVGPGSTLYSNLHSFSTYFGSMDQVQSIPNQSQIPKNGQASGKFSDSGSSNPQNSDRLWAHFGPSNPQNRGQPYIGASRGLFTHLSLTGPPKGPPFILS